MRRTLWSVLVGSVAVAIGCGGNPIKPSGTERLVGLAISGPEVLLTDSTASYTAMATLPDGSQQTVTATWISSSKDIAIVNAGGQLTTRAQGSTTLTAFFAGGSATLLDSRIDQQCSWKYPDRSRDA